MNVVNGNNEAFDVNIPFVRNAILYYTIQQYFNNNDFDGMQREYEKIREKMKEIAPIEKTLNTVNVIENLHKLIKNNGKNFDLTSEELELAKML